MPSNPYEPPTVGHVQQGSEKSQINWEAILIAVAICFGVGCALSIAWVIMGMSLAMVAGPTVATFIDNPVLMIAVYVVGFIPSVVGAIYLGRTIESRWLGHAVIYSLVNILISGLSMLIPSGSGTSWTNIGYCALLAPVSVACVLFASRYHMKQTPGTLILRIKWAFLGVATGVGLGFTLPVIFYIVWSVTHPQRGAQDWSFVAPVLLARIGKIGGGAIGLLVGAVLPGRKGIALLIAGLAVVHAGSLICYLKSNEPSLFVWILVPSIFLDVLLAFWIWPWRESALSKQA